MTDEPAPPPEVTYAALRNPRLRLLIPLVVAFAFLMEQLDATIVTTAIPDMARSLQVPPLELNLAITAYILSLAVFMPVSSWFADRFGPRRVFAAALVIFTVASMLCGLSRGLPVLVAMRALQGFGGAMMTPVGRLVLLRAFPRSQLVTAMTYMTIPAVIGPAIGPVLGGFLTTYASWRWVFYVNVPIGALGVLLALRFVEDSRADTPPKFDLVGFLLCGFGFGLLQFGLETISRSLLPRALVVASMVAGLGLLGAYVPHARRRADPVLDLSLFKIRSLRVSTLAGGLSRTGGERGAVHAAADVPDRLRAEPAGVRLADLRGERWLAVGARDHGLADAPIRLPHAADLERGVLRGGDRRLRAGAARHAALAGADP